MGRPKIARKSTNIDMTAMCDVAFLLLSFFILTTKFKAPEAISVQTPNSVSAKVAPEKNFVQIIVTKDGKVFFQIEDADKKEYMAQSLNSSKNLNLDVKAFQKAQFFATSFSQLPQYLALPEDQRKEAAFQGIPCKDSTNNEMIEWLKLAKEAYSGQKMDILLKGDNVSSYVVFKNIVSALKKNDLMKFQMVTNPEPIPAGTELFVKVMSGGQMEE